MGLREILLKEHSKGEWWVNLSWGCCVVAAAMEFAIFIDSPYRDVGRNRVYEKNKIEYGTPKTLKVPVAYSTDQSR